MDYLNEMRSQPFILGMQAEGREWITTFSPETLKEFDYVFTDALTFKDNKGRRTRLWIQAGVYFILSCIIYRYQIIRSRKMIIKQYRYMKMRRMLRERE